MNIAQHYCTFYKAKKKGLRRLSVLTESGFEGTPFTITSDDGSPVEQARVLAEKMYQEYGKYVHLVLLDCNSMDGWKGYRVFRKFI